MLKWCGIYNFGNEHIESQSKLLRNSICVAYTSVFSWNKQLQTPNKMRV